MVPSMLLHKIPCEFADRILFPFEEIIIGSNRSPTKHPGSQWNASVRGTKKSRELSTDCVFFVRTSQMERDKPRPRRHCGFAVRRAATHKQSILRTAKKKKPSIQLCQISQLSRRNVGVFFDGFFRLDSGRINVTAGKLETLSRKVQVPTENKQKIKLPWEHVYRNFLCPVRKRTS